MIDLVITSPAEGPATLFTRNFRVHSGIPIGLYRDGPRAPVVLVYGGVSDEILAELSERYEGIVAIPWMEDDDIPENPSHYETMTVKAPILAVVQHIERDGFVEFVKTFEGGPLVLRGKTRNIVTLIFTADLVKATIRILSGDLERSTGSDRYGRPNPPPESVTYAPGVSLHFNLIENALRYVYRKIGRPLLSVSRWPASSPLTLLLSHDVDVVRKWTVKRSLYELFAGLGGILRGDRRFLDTVASVSDAMKGRDPYWSFDELLFMENGNGFTSTWFFAPFGGEYRKRVNDHDPLYHRSSAEITAMIRRLLENDCEIALHGVRNAFQDGRVLKSQLDSFESRLGFKLLGVRHHYLMFRHGKTMEEAARAGVLYDSTVGFSDRPGFRTGMASPYFPFPVDDAAGSLVEIPLNFMDTVFIHAEKSADQIKRQVTEAYLYAKAAGGMFSLLVHPGNMDPMEIPELAQYYQSLLLRFRMDNARSMTAAGLARWWLTRERILKNLEFSPGMWRIRGTVLPNDLDIQISSPEIRNMKFAIEGTIGASQLNHDTLTVRPGNVDPESGITIIRKNRPDKRR